MKSVKPYTALADVYDVAMDHVDYEGWADFILHLIGDEVEKSNPSILELGCGTGLLTEQLLIQSDLFVLATDASKDMLRMARERLLPHEGRCTVKRLDFESGWDGFEESTDIVLLMYDGFNYILTPGGVSNFLEGVGHHLNEGGIVLFDQSTPSNSINNAEYFEDAGSAGDVEFVRRSTYDVKSGLHTTEFEISSEKGQFYEKHIQRAWTRKEIMEAVENSSLKIRTAFDGFSLDAADDESERIHWVLEKEF